MNSEIQPNDDLTHKKTVKCVKVQATSQRSGQQARRKTGDYSILAGDGGDGTGSLRDQVWKNVKMMCYVP